MKIKSTKIEFDLKEKHICFTIFHNLPNIQGLSIGDALENWLFRTEIFTARSFCDYLLSKNTGHIALTETEFCAFRKRSSRKITHTHKH